MPYLYIFCYSFIVYPTHIFILNRYNKNYVVKNVCSLVTYVVIMLCSLNVVVFTRFHFEKVKAMLPITLSKICYPKPVFIISFKSIQESQSHTHKRYFFRYALVWYLLALPINTDNKWK